MRSLHKQSGLRGDMLLIGTPSNSGQRPSNPKGVKVFSEIVKEICLAGYAPQTLCLDYTSPVEQVRAVLHGLSLVKTKIIVVAGDGSTTVALNAIRAVQEERCEGQVEVLISPGGTENLLSRHLGTGRKAVWKTFLRGEGSLQDLRIRELRITDAASGEEIFCGPWTSFCGVGAVARLLVHYEPQDRKRTVTENVLRALWTAYPEAVADGYVPDEFAGVTQRHLGSPIDLGPCHDYLHSDLIGSISITATSPRDAVTKFATLLAATHSPWRDTLLHGQLSTAMPAWELVKSIRPSHQRTHKVTHQVRAGDKRHIHLDGTPKVVSFAKPGNVEISLATRPGTLKIFSTK
ncbi:MAG: hypothetical protein HY817_02770 [Candidatus Abawacabacteria bacterium]|nr:hypothetical protein [Candidatus Abawacabacteria bacterium]